MILRRILAFLIDFSLGIFFSELGVYLLRREVLAGTPRDDLFNPLRQWALSSFHFWAVSAGIFLYFFLFLAALSETPGLSLFGLTVVRDSDDGELRAIGTRRALSRTLSLLVSLMTLGLGFLFALGNDRRRALHDCLSGTRVIRQKTIPSPRPAEAS